jgi:hypothetical protein
MYLPVRFVTGGLTAGFLGCNPIQFEYCTVPVRPAKFLPVRDRTDLGDLVLLLAGL